MVAARLSCRTAWASRLSWVSTITWPVDSGLLQHSGKAVDLGRVHRLHRVVDDQEPERAFGKSRPGQEHAQRERVGLALAHDA
jgi:hypothetical protein